MALAMRHGLGRRLSAPPLLAFALAATLGMVLVVTLTPSSDGGFWGRSRVASFALTGEVFSQITTVNHMSLNVALLVPLALLVQLVARREVRRLLIAGVFALPLAIEFVQYGLPVLGRSGFQMDDVVANTLGVLAGTALGLLARTRLERAGHGRSLLTAPLAAGHRAQAQRRRR